MTGLELCRTFWEEVGRPAFQAECPEALERGTFGLVGEGSECFGCDDEVSRDHDWGPGFCLWLTDGDMAAFGDRAGQVYQSLPREFRGFRRLRQTGESARRVGVMTVGSFYGRYLGRETPPATVADWRRMPANGLAVVTNGALVWERNGEFAAFRAALLAYYPEDLRRKKLARQCALAAQQGQYNFARCRLHGEPVSALIALSQFIQNAQQIAYLLGRRYAPYYKWSQRLLPSLPGPGPAMAPLLTALAEDPRANQTSLIEKVCALIADELRRQGLSATRDTFLLSHAMEIQNSITDESLKRLHLMAE